MLEGGVAAIPMRGRPSEPVLIGGDELVRGLLLVRSSAINLARLHVAMERQDRRVVIETMDDLAALDRQIEKFVEEIPTSDSGIPVLQAELAQQKNTLAREKLAFGAGIIRKEQRPVTTETSLLGLAEQQVAATQAPPVSGAPSEAHVHVDELGEAEWLDAGDEVEPRRWPLILTATCLLLMAVGFAGLLFTPAGQEIAGYLLATAGA